MSFTEMLYFVCITGHTVLYIHCKKGYNHIILTVPTFVEGKKRQAYEHFVATVQSQYRKSSHLDLRQIYKHPENFQNLLTKGLHFKPKSNK